MKRLGIATVVIFASLFLLLMDLFAYELAIRRAGSGGWAKETMYGSMFNPDTVETIEGKVISMESFTPLRRMAYGYLVKVQTEQETVPVHLGPGYYVDREAFKLEPGDQVVVTGSRILFDGRPAIIATEVKKGDQILKLRAEDGTPLWLDDYGEPKGG